MSASFKFDGLAEMRQALASLPDEVTDRALVPAIQASADGLAADVIRQYPARDGALRKGVRIVYDATNRLVVRVKTAAKHSHLYEYGTIRRFTAGTGAFRGTMPAHPVFVPAAVRWRGRMLQRVAQTLQSLKVPGFSGTVGGRLS